MPRLRHKRRVGGRGVTLVELLIAVGVMGMLAYASSTIYFSVLNIYNRQIWRLPPYDAATAAVQRVSRDIRDAMLIESHGPDFLVVIIPQRTAERENVLTLGANGYELAQGDQVKYYLSDGTGSLEAAGNCLWQAVKPLGADVFTPRVKIADNIHPELNPTDPETGLPRPVFRYWPDAIRLWGVEVWMTSIANVHGQPRAQSAHSESYLRNL